MSLPPVTIRRLSATAHLDPGAAEEGARIGRLLGGVAELRLDRALRSLTLPPGLWCLRRVEAPVRLDLERPDSALEEAWAVVLSRAVGRALATGSAEAVRYRGSPDALADLVDGIATGRLERAWAWRGLGLQQPADPDPAQAPKEAMLAALGRRPEQATAAVVAAAGRVGVAALHRTLGPAGWASVAGVAARALGAGRPEAHAGLDVQTVAGAGSVAAEPPVEALAGRTVAASRFAAAARRSRLRPGPATLAAWAVIVVAEADPSLLWRAAATSVLRAVADALVVPAPPGSGSGPGPAPAAGPSVAGRQSATARPREGDPTSAAGLDGAGQGTETPARNQPPMVAPPAVGRRHAGGGDGPTGLEAAAAAAAADPLYPTGWAGLLFLLATAASAGVPDDVLDNPAFALRPLRWVLQGVATRLGPPAGDPAVAAFTGLDPGLPGPWRLDPPATPAELDELDTLARRWSAATALALGRPDDPAEVVAGMVRRPGVVSYTTGWIELRMALDQVDLDVRRAGLDLDPGWVPWLGAVLRYVYG
jgi:hypothetical protein